MNLINKTNKITKQIIDYDICINHEFINQHSLISNQQS